MTADAITAFAGLSRTVLGLREIFDASDWSRPSDCPGWSNHDVIVHLVCTLREIVEPETLPAPVAGSIERTNDVGVAAFRREHPADTLDAYHRLLPEAVAALTRMQREPAAAQKVDFDDAGSYPAHLIADSLVFDHYCHLRHDLVAREAGGTPALLGAADETVMSASLAWLLAGLPQMSPPRLTSGLTAPVTLALTGPGGGSWTLVPAHGSTQITVEPGASSAARARVTASAESFLLWGTHRRPWRDAGLTLSGDEALAATALDSLHVF